MIEDVPSGDAEVSGVFVPEFIEVGIVNTVEDLCFEGRVHVAMLVINETGAFVLCRGQVAVSLGGARRSGRLGAWVDGRHISCSAECCVQRKSHYEANVAMLSASEWCGGGCSIVLEELDHIVDGFIVGLPLDDRECFVWKLGNDVVDRDSHGMFEKTSRV